MNVYLAESGGAMQAYLRREKIMDLYLAGCEFLKTYIEREGQKHTFDGANILQSFYYVNDFTVKEILPNCKRFLLDSGAFTFFTKGKEGMDWDEYLKKYADFINTYDIDLFLELDIDRIVGYDEVLRLRKNLEDMTGKKCIPVWHKERGKEEFIKMVEDYDYVAIGGIAKNPNGKQVEKMFPWFIETAHQHGAKIHGLGYTSVKNLSRYHFDSVDSTAWISGNQYGGVYEFTGSSLIKHKKPEGTRMSNPARLALHNFSEWKKFADYAEKKL